MQVRCFLYLSMDMSLEEVAGVSSVRVYPGTNGCPNIQYCIIGILGWLSKH